MNEKLFGNILIGRTVFGLFTYFIFSVLTVFIIKFIYTLLFLKLGFTFILLDLIVWVLLVALTSIIAGKVILIFKIENVKFFSKLTILSSLFLVYIYYYANIAAYLFDVGMIIFPHEVKEVFLGFEAIFSEGISISSKGRTGLTLPSLINYIFALIVTISFIVPKGSFTLEKGIYIDGVKVNFKKYYLFSTSSIDEINLSSESDIYLASEAELKEDVLIKGEYYTLFVSEDYANNVYCLVKNGYKEKKGKSSITFNSGATYYYKVNQSVRDCISNSQQYSKLKNEDNLKEIEM